MNDLDERLSSLHRFAIDAASFRPPIETIEESANAQHQRQRLAWWGLSGLIVLLGVVSAIRIADNDSVVASEANDSSVQTLPEEVEVPEPYPPDLDCAGRSIGTVSFLTTGGGSQPTVLEAAVLWLDETQSIVPGFSLTGGTVAVADDDGAVRAHLLVERVGSGWLVTSTTGC